MIARVVITLVFTFMSCGVKAELSAREKISIIMYSAVGGSILGLSTLSFYGKPSDHVSNIYTGAAIGMIGGASYIGYKTFGGVEEKPHNSYDFGFVPINGNQWTAVYAVSF